MDKITKELIQEIDKLMTLGDQLIAFAKTCGGTMPDEKIKEFTNWTTRTGELIKRIYPKKDSQYYIQYDVFRSSMNMNNLHSNSYSGLLKVLGSLEGIKYELENGLLSKLKSIVQADIFSDFLEMGEHLLKEGYKDAAAVIIGTVLEDTLRKIADANGKKIINDKGKYLTIDPLNVELEKAGIYNQLVKKQITSWADLRNNASHGHFDQYDIRQVEMMLQFVQAFTAEYLK